MCKWYIYGAGGLGLETMDTLIDSTDDNDSQSNEFAFLVDSPTASKINGYQVVAWNDCDPNAKVTIAVGEPELRANLAKKCELKGLTLSSIISPEAFVSASAFVGDGVIVAPFASVQANAYLAPNVAVNTQAIIGHHVSVMNSAVISSQVNLGGASKVGEKSYIGMGALVKEKVSIGSQSVLGMGSVAYKDIPDEVIAIGNPARPAKRNENKRVFN